MGREMQVPLAYDTKEQDILGSEELINFYAIRSEGGKYPFKLIGTPGLAKYCDLPTSPIKALHEMDGRVFAVTSTKFYEVFNNDTYTELGTVSMSGKVVMADNGNHIVMVDGENGYYWNSTTDAFAQFSGAGWYPARTVAYQDGYFIFDRKGTSQFFISNLLDITFDALDFASAEGQPDNLIAVLSDHREVFMFGSQSTEIWYNSGADFPFERNQGAFIEKGIAGPYCAAKENNTVYFVGSDLMVYQINGYTPIRISTRAVEKDLMQADLSTVFCFTTRDQGSLFYYLTIPSKQKTWRYDISTGLWQVMKDYIFDRHRAENSIFVDHKTLVGDFQSGRIYYMTRDELEEDGSPIVREVVLPDITMGRKFFTISSLELDVTAGVGKATGQGSDPLVTMVFSKDGGKTWSDFKTASLGKTGEYTHRVKWRRLGRSRQFTFKIMYSEPVPLEIGAAFVEVS